jgi:hypothetical protein
MSVRSAIQFTAADRRLRLWLVAIVVVHLVVALWHGVAHAHVPVPLTGMQTAFVAVVIFALPLVGVPLLWTSRRSLAAWIIAGSMLASLLFGFLNHFVLDSPDYVIRVPEHAWRHSFVESAALVAISEAIGTVLGLLAVVKWRERSDSPESPP